VAFQSIITEIQAKRSHVWNLLTTPKEVAFWAPNVRDLEQEPRDRFDVDTVRSYRLDVGGRIETLETVITHCITGEMFAEKPIGGSMKIHEKVEKMKIVFRLMDAETDEKRCSLAFSMEYETKGLMGKLFEKVTIGGFISQYKIWFDRLKTYAETGRPV